MPEPTPLPVRKKRGPNTPEGKARSAMNALKHGLRARSFGLLPEESKAEWAEHLGDLRGSYRPQDAAEEKLVTALAAAMWLEIRADRTLVETMAEIPPAAPAAATAPTSRSRATPRRSAPPSATRPPPAWRPSGRCGRSSPTARRSRTGWCRRGGREPANAGGCGRARARQSELHERIPSRSPEPEPPAPEPGRTRAWPAPVAACRRRRGR